MQKINSPQKKIIFITLIIIFTFMIFWFFIYLQSNNVVHKIKAELAGLETQLLEIETAMSEGRSMQENITLLIDRARELENKFPGGEENGLSEISDLANKLNIEIISFKPQPKTEFIGQDGQGIVIEGKTCRRLAVSIGMRCAFGDLVKYITALSDKLPVFVSIDNLKINKDNSGAAKLNIVLELSLYLLS